MEYIQSKFMQLADSLLAPVWAWVMARCWMFRSCVLVLGGVIVLSWHKPEIVSENYRLGISTLKVAMADGGLALDSDTKAKLLSTTQRLADELRGTGAMVDWTSNCGGRGRRAADPPSLRPKSYIAHSQQ